jgi:hypothetical protein
MLGILIRQCVLWRVQVWCTILSLQYLDSVVQTGNRTGMLGFLIAQPCDYLGVTIDATFYGNMFAIFRIFPKIQDSSEGRGDGAH